MNHRLNRLHIACTLALFAPLAMADETLPTLDVVGEVTPEEHRLKQTAPQVTVRRETFEKQAGGPLINDVIKRLPGVYTGGAPGENKDLRLRGLDKEFSRVQFDGVQLPDGGEKRELNLDRLPTSLVGEVTVIRSPSAEHEADGLAGRVHIETREIPLEEQIEVGLGLGRQDDSDGHQGSLTYGNRFSDRFGLQATIARIENPLTRQKEKFGANGLLKETEREDKPLTNTSALLDAGYFYSSGEWHLKPLYLKDDEDKDKLKTKLQNDGVTIKEFEGEDENMVKETGGITLDNRHHLSEASRLDTAIGYYRTTEEKDKLKRKFNTAMLEDPSKRETEEEEKEDKFWQGDIKLTHDWSSAFDNELKVGARLRQRERFREKDVFKADGSLKSGNAKDDYRLEEDYLAAFVQNEMQLTDRLSLLPGLRFERMDLTARDGIGNSDDSRFTDWLPSLSANYRINEHLALHAAAAQVVNRPKFDELAPFEQDNNDGTVTLGNPDLEPARANTLDFGFDYVTGPLFVGVNLFYRDIEGVIEEIDTGTLSGGNRVLQVENVGDGTLKGIELEQRVSAGPFTITANQSFIDSQLKFADGTTTPFKEQPDFIGNLIVDWENPASGTGISVAYRYIAEIDKSAKFDGLGDESFLDIKLSQRIAKGWSATLTGTNLTDAERVKDIVNGERDREETDPTLWVGIEGRF